MFTCTQKLPRLGTHVLTGIGAINEGYLRTKDTAAVVDWCSAHGAKRQPRGATGADDEVAAIEEHDAAWVRETHDAVLKLGLGLVGRATHGRFVRRCRGSCSDFTSRTLCVKQNHR